MKFLKLVLVHVPDQVLSTFVIWAFGFIFYRGCLSVFADLPSTQTILVVIFIGMALGLFTAKGQITLDEKNIEAPKVDR